MGLDGIHRGTNTPGDSQIGIRDCESGFEGFHLLSTYREECAEALLMKLWAYTLEWVKHEYQCP